MSDKEQKGLIQYINNQFSSLRYQMGRMLGVSHDGERDLNSIYGYPEEIQFQDTFGQADRGGVGNFLTEGVAKLCWDDGFEIYDGPDKDGEKANKILEDELNTLNKRGLTKKLQMADALNRMGPFSVLFVGIPDGLDPSLPIGPVLGDKLHLIYFKPFAYDGIQISKQEPDTKNPRYSLPEMYQVQETNISGEKKDSIQTSINVHWSRIIHINEGALTSDVDGRSAIHSVYNRLLDLNKTSGGASEAYFRNARPKTTYEVDKDFAPKLINDDKAKTAFDEGAKAFTNQWKDWVVAAGAKVNAIFTPHASPKETLMGSYWEVSAQSRFPIRFLIGEGSGQLAGSEDQLAANAIIAGRQRVECAPLVVRFLEMITDAKMIKLDGDFEVRFPVQQAVTEAQEAEINNKNANTIKTVFDAAGTPGGDELDPVGTLKTLGIDVETDDTFDATDPEGIDDEDENENKDI